jgi:endonuclease/exonuclease/phosphatase (EEP) superfamily protein YafD
MILMKIWSVYFWVNIVAAICTLATFLGFASPLWWILVMLEHPRPQYALVLVIATIVGLLVPKRRTAKMWSLIWLIPLCINLGLIAPVFVASSHNQSNSTNDTLKILHATLDRTNPEQVGQVIEYLEGQQVDLVSLIEVTPEYLTQLQFGLKNYLILTAKPKSNTHGSAWLASTKLSPKIEFRDSEVIHLPATNDRPLLKITMSLGGKEIVLVSFQAIRPRDRHTVAYQKLEFAALVDWSLQFLKSPNQELVAIGDYNSTPWYSLFRQMLSDSGLVNSQSGFGLQPTWHASFPSILQLPIDHCLHSPGIHVIRRYIGHHIGSDHLPLFVELSLD